MLYRHVYVNVLALISVDRRWDSLYSEQCCPGIPASRYVLDRPLDSIVAILANRKMQVCGDAGVWVYQRVKFKAKVQAPWCRGG